MKTVGFLIEIAGNQSRNIYVIIVCRMKRICIGCSEKTLCGAFHRLQWLVPQRQYGTQLTRNGKTSIRKNATGMSGSWPRPLALAGSSCHKCQFTAWVPSGGRISTFDSGNPLDCLGRLGEEQRVGFLEQAVMSIIIEIKLWYTTYQWTITMATVFHQVTITP